MAAILVQGSVKAAKILTGLFLHPALAASALLFLEYGSPTAVSRLIELGLAKHVGIHRLKVALRVLLGLGLGRALNRVQNLRASNHWSLASRGGWRWAEEIAVVTGGCHGIGKATVLGLVQKGVRVAVLDVADLPPDLVRLPTVFHWKCDITSPDAVHDAADQIRDRLGHPSILINNAGLAHYDSILDLPPAKLDRLFAVNALSHWHTVRAFLPTMVLRDKGHIVTVASVASFVALPQAVDYSASKAAALAFHEGLACEIRNVYRSPGVLTTVVHPSFVNTNMTAPAKQRIEARSGPMLEPRDVADAIVKQIGSRRGAQLIVPPSSAWLSGLRGFPNWLQETVRDMAAKGA
ncbi:hypothetical protein VTK73DRAFT_4049 [Phialemonium thermophilum]|uniref:Uncharacterized protein n=1 Tax=Phialemonium thermophilum TaxID=223376 RepID=A0ABR3WVH1_9PEZI